MTQTSYVNPNGLPADGQITSARDLGILARAIIRDLPEYEYFVHIPAIRFGKPRHAEFQQADRPLSRRRRLQDRLHLRLRLQSRGLRHPQRQAADRGGARGLLRPDARGARGADARARLCQQLARLARVPRSAPSTIWCRSTPRRRTCATRCAAASATSRPATRTRTPIASTRRLRPAPATTSLMFFTAGLQPPIAEAVRTAGRGARRHASRSWSIPARPGPAPPWSPPSPRIPTSRVTPQRGQEGAACAKKPDAVAEPKAGAKEADQGRRLR